ncbi:MAG: HEAT repeat domain-containing protein [Gemmataceae bacterium]
MASLSRLALIALLLGAPIAPAQDKSVKEYADALKHPDIRVRLAGLSGLAAAADEAGPYSEAVARLLKDTYPQVRRAAAQVLGLLGKDAEKAAPALAAALKDADPLVKQLSAKALIDIGGGSIPALAPLFKDPADASARLLAVHVIETIGDSAEAPKVLALAVKDGAGKVRQAAIAALVKLKDSEGVDPKDVSAALSVALWDKATEVRLAAAAALIDMDKAGAIPLFLKAYKDDALAVRQTALQALASLGDELDMDAMLLLRGALEDKDAKIRQYAAAGLGKAGVKARELAEGKKVLAGLFKLMTDKEMKVREVAVYALGQVGIDDEGELKMLAEGYKDMSPAVRAMTVQALAQYSHDEAPADWRKLVLKHVAEGLKDKDKRVVYTAGKTLIGEKTFAVPALIKVIEGPAGATRTVAAQVLGEIGEDATEAVPALQKMSREGSAENRQAALLALQKIMP